MRPKFRLLFLCGVSTLLLCGCPRRERDPVNDHLNGLWESGYGYGNPNPERLRNGQKPVKFIDDDD